MRVYIRILDTGIFARLDTQHFAAAGIAYYVFDFWIAPRVCCLTVVEIVAFESERQPRIRLVETPSPKLLPQRRSLQRFPSGGDA